MNEARVVQLMALFEQVVNLPRDRRDAFLEQSVGDDVALRRELDSLLEAHESAEEYFDDLAGQLVSPAYAAVVNAEQQSRGAALRSRLEAALGDHYRILQDLGGGMSRVFLAEEIKLARKVVIKVLPPEMAASANADRFRREIQLAAQLQHPHIVPLLTSDSADSLLYYTMPYVAGESLRDRLTRDGALPILDARKIWRDILDALAHAHAVGVIHRDIKPGNILLGAGSALVSDFGIARAIEAAGDVTDTSPGLTIGTPAYMAPEQVTGDTDTDHRVDIYAAGLVMYEMLTGRLPFSGDSAREVIFARLTRDPAPVGRADCPPELEQLVMQCLARAPDERSPAAGVVLAAMESIPRSEVARPRPARRRLPYVLAALALVVASLGAMQLMHDRPGASVPAAAPEQSIAVLPLGSLGTDRGDAVIADGITEELIGMLSAVRGLRVVPSTSVISLRDRGMDARQIAESLRVSHLLEGGIQMVDRRLRLRVRLVDTRNDSTVWAGAYDREMGDVFAIQDDISRRVSEEIGARLAGRGQFAVRRRTPGIVAYEAYLRGMDVSLMRSRAGNQRALAYFNEAIASDSSFAAAYAGLVRVYLALPGNERDLQARAKAAALKAVALDPSLAEAHVGLGWASTGTWEWAAAEDAFKRAIAINPGAPRAYEGLARLYMYTGKLDEQLAAARKGLEVDPFSHSAIRELALALSVSGGCDEAIALLRPLKTLNPPAGVAGVIMGQCYVAKGQWPDAIREFQWTIDNSTARTALAFLGHAHARAGDRDRAMRILSDLLAGRQYSHGAFGIASVYAGLGNRDEAFAWLDKAVDESSIRVYLMGPMFDELRRDARFARVKKKMGL